MTQYSQSLRSPAAAALFGELYGADAGRQPDRYLRLLDAFRDRYGSLKGVQLFSASGRAEIAGNHTDHNGGRVLAAAVTFDTIAAVRPVPGSAVTLVSEGYPQAFVVDLGSLDPVPSERNTTAALIRGVAARLQALGCPIGAFQAAVASDIVSGSGLSSSAAFEVLLTAVFDGLFGGSRVDPLERARVAQFAENAYFGKPCGLMDQTASSLGGLVGIDFSGREAAVRTLRFDFRAAGYALCVVSTGSGHDDLTADYAAIPAEMKQVAACFGQSRLIDVPRADFLDRLPDLRRGGEPDRALLRAEHFYAENERVDRATEALAAGDLPLFFEQLNRSGLSSWTRLQNLYTGPSVGQSLCLCLAESERLLGGAGACRVHGGGFAGTILAFVPDSRLGAYRARMEQLFGPGACAALGIRPLGACRVARDPEQFLTIS